MYTALLSRSLQWVATRLFVGVVGLALFVMQDFAFILKGVTRLLNNPLLQTYLPGSCKRIQFHQELLIFFWKLCDINKVHVSSYFFTLLLTYSFVGLFVNSSVLRLCPLTSSTALILSHTYYWLMTGRTCHLAQTIPKRNSFGRPSEDLP